MSDYSFEITFSMPHEGSLHADQLRSASEEFAVRCFHEAYGVEEISDLDAEKQPGARTLMQASYEKALNNIELPLKIIREWEESDNDSYDEEQE